MKLRSLDVQCSTLQNLKRKTEYLDVNGDEKLCDQQLLLINFTTHEGTEGKFPCSLLAQ